MQALNIHESQEQWLQRLKEKDEAGMIRPGTPFPFLSDLLGGKIISPPFEETQNVRALDLVNNLIMLPWRHQGKWRTISKPSSVPAGNSEITITLKADEVLADLTILHVPLLLIHISPQTVKGVGNARYQVEIKHDIDNQRSVSYEFEVLPMNLDATVVYLGADIVDTLAVHKGITIGNAALTATRTTEIKRRMSVKVSSLPELSQVYIEIPSRDHPFSDAIINRVLGYLGQQPSEV